MNSIIGKLISWMVRELIIQEEDQEVYYFGIRQGIIYIINVITIILIGLITGTTIQLLIFLVSYIAIRNYAGGYHVESELGCYIVSMTLVIIVALLNKYVQWNIIYTTSILSVVAMIILILAPVEDRHKPLDALEIKVYTRRMRVALIIELGVASIAGFYNQFIVFNSIAIGIIIAGGLVVIGYIKNIRLS